MRAAKTNMNFARAFHTSVVLPDGTVLIMGGQPYPVPFSDYLGVLAAELWDPATETFHVLAEVVLSTAFVSQTYTRGSPVSGFGVQGHGLPCHVCREQGPA